MKTSIKDNRYTIGLEYTGHISAKPRFVLRFCGEFITDKSTKEHAEVEAVKHAENRGDNHTNWNVIKSEDDYVLLLGSSDQYRVCYGADVRNYTDRTEALKEYKSAFYHYKESSIRV